MACHLRNSLKSIDRSINASNPKSRCRLCREKGRKKAAMEIECNSLTFAHNRQNGKQLDVRIGSYHGFWVCVCASALCVQNANSSYLSWPHAYRENYYLCRVCAQIIVIYYYIYLWNMMKYQQLLLLLFSHTQTFAGTISVNLLIKLQFIFMYIYAPASSVRSLSSGVRDSAVGWRTTMCGWIAHHQRMCTTNGPAMCVCAECQMHYNLQR